ncbi:MAG: hypothetical protein AB2A00_21075 [Myxococcota bacterium]
MFVIALVPTPPPAEVVDKPSVQLWKAHGDRGDELYRARDYVGAEKEYLAGIVVADGKFEGRALIDPHFGALVRVWSAMGLVDEKLRNPWPVDVHGEEWRHARAHWLKALLYCEKADYPAAEREMFALLDAAEMLMPPDAPGWRLLLTRMAFIRAAQGDVHGAIWWYGHPGGAVESSAREDPLDASVSTLLECVRSHMRSRGQDIESCYQWAEGEMLNRLHARHPALVVQWRLHAAKLRYQEEEPQRAAKLAKQADALEAALRRRK